MKVYRAVLPSVETWIWALASGIAGGILRVAVNGPGLLLGMEGQRGHQGCGEPKLLRHTLSPFGGIGRLFPVGSVRDGVVDSCFGEGAKPQDATLACAAGGLVACIARPRYMEGRGQFKAAADYLVLAHRDKRSFDADGAVARAGANELLKGLVVGGTAVGIAGAVLLDRTDVDRPRRRAPRPN